MPFLFFEIHILPFKFTCTRLQQENLQESKSFPPRIECSTLHFTWVKSYKLEIMKIATYIVLIANSFPCVLNNFLWSSFNSACVIFPTPHVCNSFNSEFPAQKCWLIKKSRTRPDRWARRCRAAVFNPNWRTSRVHHKKGRPRAATSHESRLGKPSFALPVFAWDYSFGAKTDNSIDTELVKLLG